MSKIRIAGFVNDSITDGPGLRFTIFTQGCPHHCVGCHNPQTHDFEAGKLVDSEEIIHNMLSNSLLKGITFSGGEPMCQAKELLPIAIEAKQNNLEIAIYSGFTFEQLIALRDDNINKLLSLADTLVDGKFEIDKKSYALKFKGSSNQRVIELKKSMVSKTAILETSERWN